MIKKNIVFGNRLKYIFAAIIFAILVIIFCHFLTTLIVKNLLINILKTEFKSDVKIDGIFKIKYSLTPSVQLTELRVLNPESFNNELFIRLGNVKFKFKILPLLKNRIYIKNINLENAVINLEKDINGNASWDSILEADIDFVKPDDLAIDKLIFNNILINYSEPGFDEEKKITIDRSIINFPRDSDVSALLKGTYFNEQFAIKLSGGSYKQLNDTNQYWPLNLQISLSENILHVEGKIKNLLNPNDIDLDMSVNAEDLNLESIIIIIADSYNKSFDNYNGYIDKFDLKLNGSGSNIKDIFFSSSAKLNIKNLNLLKHNIGGDKFENIIKLNSIDVILNKSESSLLNIKGFIMGYQLGIDISGCSKADFFNGENCDLNLAGKYGSSKISINGMFRKNEAGINGILNTDINIPTMEQFKFIFDIPEGYKLPAKLSLKLIKEGQNIFVKNADLKIGKSEITGEFEKKITNCCNNYHISINSKKLDMNELIAIMPRKDQTGKTDLLYKAPIIPKNLSIFDARIKIDLKNISYNNLIINNFFINSHIKNNVEKSSEIILKTSRGDFRGFYDLNLNSELPQIKFNIETRDLFIGKLLTELNITDTDIVNFNTKNLNFQLNIIGSTLGEIISNSSLTVNFDKGIYTIENIDEGEDFDIIMENGHLELYLNEPVKLILSGLINKVPVKLQLEANHLIRTYIESNDHKVPIILKLNIMDTNIKLKGFTKLPLNNLNSEFKISIKGENLSDINKLLLLNLPNNGPFYLSFDLKVKEKVYSLENIDLTFINSELNGNVILDTRGKPDLDLKIESKNLNLDDFFSSGSIEDDGGEFTPVVTGNYAKLPGFKKFDADLEVVFNNILLNEKVIGNAEFTGKLENGNLLMDLVIINMSGGEAKFEITGNEVNNTNEISLVGNVNNFDYSPLSRILDPNSKNTGVVDLTLNFSTRGKLLRELEDNLEGEIKFNLKPTEFYTEIVDFWALSIFYQILPNWSSDEEDISQVNCITGDIKLNNGLLTPDKMKIDTTNVRVDVKGKIDLTNNYIDLIFSPKPKKAQLYDLGVPIIIVGDFENYYMGPEPFGIMTWIIRVTYAGYIYIIELITNKHIPEDGSDLCNKNQ